MRLPVRNGQRCGQKERAGRRKTERDREVIDTRFPNEDFYLYERNTKQSYCGRRKKKLYMNIFMSTLSWEKINILIGGIFLYWF